MLVLQIQFLHIILLFVSGTSIWPWQQCSLLGHCSIENRCWEILSSFWGTSYVHSISLHIVDVLVVGILSNGRDFLYSRFHLRNQSMKVFMLLEGETLRMYLSQDWSKLTRQTLEFLTMMLEPLSQSKSKLFKVIWVHAISLNELPKTLKTFCSCLNELSISVMSISFIHAVLQ